MLLAFVAAWTLSVVFRHFFHRGHGHMADGGGPARPVELRMHWPAVFAWDRSDKL